VAPAFPALPAPLVFTPVTFGAETWMETALPIKAGVTAPVYLSHDQHKKLLRFIKEEPSATQQLLIPVGTIKSGKSTLLHRVLPGMLAAAHGDATLWPSTRKQPVLFTYQFRLGHDALDAAMHLQDALANFARKINVAFDEEATATKALNNLPINVEDFAKRIQASGGELWLLLDELQAPILESNDAFMKDFTYMFKEVSSTGVWTCGCCYPSLQQRALCLASCFLLTAAVLPACVPFLLRHGLLQVVDKVSPLGRIVATGSGLVALLNAIRTARVNGYALWDAVSFLSVGREPTPGTQLDMAANILRSYAASWPKDAQQAITPAAVVTALQPTAHSELTSARPALLAYTLGRMGDASSGAPQHVLGAAVGAALSKLQAESVRDTVRALVSLGLTERQVLRAVAAGLYTCDELDAIADGKGKVGFKQVSVGIQPEKLAALINCLRETGAGSDTARLQPPYSALLLSWLTPSGDLAVCVDNGQIDLAIDIRKNLVFIAEPAQRRIIADAGLQPKVSHAVLQALASDGIGVVQQDGSVKAPATAAEFDAVPALSTLRDMLKANVPQGHRQPSLAKLVSDAAAAALPAAAAPSAAAATAHASAAASFADKIGWELLLAFRHFEAHIWWSNVAQLVHNGLTAAVVAQALRAASNVLTASQGGCFVVNPAAPGRLMLKP